MQQSLQKPERARPPGGKSGQRGGAESKDQAPLSFVSTGPRAPREPSPWRSGATASRPERLSLSRTAGEEPGSASRGGFISWRSRSAPPPPRQFLGEGAGGRGPAAACARARTPHPAPRPIPRFRCISADDVRSPRVHSLQRATETIGAARWRAGWGRITLPRFARFRRGKPRGGGR